MKRTKSMHVCETPEAQELFLYAVNDGTLYARAIVPTVRSLARKHARGIFDADRAIDAFYYVACTASDEYRREFGYKFDVTARFTAAADMVEYYRENIENNDI